MEVVPGEVVFDRQGQQHRLQVIAHWRDGSREDVTEISRFTSNDDAIATVTEVGMVTSGDPGDTHIVVACDKAVVAVPMLRPVSELTGDQYPEAGSCVNQTS